MIQKNIGNSAAPTPAPSALGEAKLKQSQGKSGSLGDNSLAVLASGSSHNSQKP
jgi:hypothetical protein